MYIPKPFDQTDRAAQLELIRAHPFGILITGPEGSLQVTHVPMYHAAWEGEDLLLGHLARANTHSQALEGPGLAIFQGPHAYVSHRWYESTNVVPTWNYVAVHVAGRLSVASPAELERILESTLRAQGEDPADLKAGMEEKVYATLSSHIVGFKLAIESIEGKWKLSQNKSAEAQARIVAALEKTGLVGDKALADLMRENLDRH